MRFLIAFGVPEKSVFTRLFRVFAIAMLANFQDRLVMTASITLRVIARRGLRRGLASAKSASWFIGEADITLREDSPHHSITFLFKSQDVLQKKCRRGHPLGFPGRILSSAFLVCLSYLWGGGAI